MIRQENDQLFFNGKYIGQCFQDVDGYYKWWPNQQYGYLDELFLLSMYEFLKEKNAAWDAAIKANLGEQR